MWWALAAWALDPAPSTAPVAAPGPRVAEFYSGLQVGWIARSFGFDSLAGMKAHTQKWVWRVDVRGIHDSDSIGLRPGFGYMLVDRPKLRMTGFAQGDVDLESFGHWIRPGLGLVWMPKPTLRVDFTWGVAVRPLNLDRPTWGGPVDLTYSLPELGVSTVLGNTTPWTLRVALRGTEAVVGVRVDRAVTRSTVPFTEVMVVGSLEGAMLVVRTGLHVRKSPPSDSELDSRPDLPEGPLE